MNLEQTFKFNKDFLIRTIKENREKHVDEVTEAKAGYKLAMMKRLSSLRRRVNAGEILETHKALNDLPTPHDHTKDYDLVIEMLVACTETEIALDTTDFRKYVKDEWEWSALSKFANSTYSASNRR